MQFAHHFDLVKLMRSDESDRKKVKLNAYTPVQLLVIYITDSQFKINRKIEQN